MYPVDHSLALAIVLGTLLVAADPILLIGFTLTVVTALSVVKYAKIVPVLRLLGEKIPSNVHIDSLPCIMDSNLVSADVKLQHLLQLKARIKHENVDPSQIPEIFAIIEEAFSIPLLNDEALSTLIHFIKRLKLQNMAYMTRHHIHPLFESMIDGLISSSNTTRARAGQALTDVWTVASADVERFLRENTFLGQNPRLKVVALQWIVKMHDQKEMHVGSFAPQMADCLYDVDANVRDTAKTTVLILFDGQTSQDYERKQFRSQLRRRRVPRDISQAILTQLGLPLDDTDNATTSSAPHPVDTSKASLSRVDPPRADLPEPDLLGTENFRPRPNSDTSKPKAMMSTATLHTIPAPNDADDDKIEPLHMTTARELEEAFREMTPFFEGKETEQNWIKREKSILKLRRITKGNAPQDISPIYLTGIKTLLDGILKVVNSLRTTLSSAGCFLVQEIARTTGPGIDNMVEILLQSLIKLCASTKKIAANRANNTVDVIMANVGYHTRLIQHIWIACQDKNVQPRTFAPGWLKTLLTRPAFNRHALEHAGGIDLLEKCIIKGLADANLSVRGNMRPTYWSYAAIWPERSETMLNAMEKKQQHLLISDAANPNPEKRGFSGSTSTGSRIGTASTTTGSATAKPSIRDTIQAQKRAKLAGKLPERPASVETVPTNTRPPPTPARPTTAMATASRHVSSASVGTLLSAPMRPMRAPKRPEMSRPVTADVALSHRVPRKETPNATPAVTSATRSMKMRPKTPSAAVAKPLLNPKKSEKPTVSPTKRVTRRASCDEKSLKSEISFPSSPTKAAEDFTMVIPNLKSEALELDRNDGDADEVTILRSTSPADRGVDGNIPSEDLSKVGSLMRTPRPHDFASSNKDSPQRLSPLKHDFHSTWPPNIQQAYAHDAAESKPIGFGRNENVSPQTKSPIKGRIRDASTSPQKISMSPRPIVSKKENNTHRSSLMGEQRPLKVYEDPDAQFPKDEPTAISISLSHWNALEELPVNEPTNHPESPSGLKSTQEVGPFSPHSERKAPAAVKLDNPLQARRILDSALARVRAQTLDIHGFRKLQSVIRSQYNLWEDADKFEELLLPLLEHLETPMDESAAGFKTAQDLKTQVLITIRLMLQRQPNYASAYYPRTMCALVNARKYLSSTSHLAAGLEETMESIMPDCSNDDCISAILDLLETEPTEGYGAMAYQTGYFVLAGLLRRSRTFGVEPLEQERLGKLGGYGLSHGLSGIRKAAIEFGLQLHDAVGDEKFWPLLGGKRAQSADLMTYYLMRRV